MLLGNAVERRADTQRVPGLTTQPVSEGGCWRWFLAATVAKPYDAERQADRAYCETMGGTGLD